jgi:beta-RFAP synthase
LSVCLHETLPTHAGFGSGTQLALALGRAFAAVHGIEVTSAELAALLGRGARSGIGIAAFDAGGLVLDAGPGRRGPAPVLARVPFPPCWRVLLVIEPQMRGRHGADEAHALAALPPLPQAAAAGLAHLTLMGILPAALEADFRAFARGVSEMQRVLGAYFAPAQGGNAYTSPAVARLLQWIGANFEAGVGQSSWGPTGFAIFESPPAARRAVDDARRAGVAAPHLDLRIVGGRNCGAALDFPE